MSYSEGDDSDGSCEGFPADDDERECRMRIDSSTDGDAKSDGDENIASESGAFFCQTAHHWSCSVIERDIVDSTTTCPLGAAIPAQHHVFIFAVFVEEHQLYSILASKASLFLKSSVSIN